jgi:hypothetical protein
LAVANLLFEPGCDLAEELIELDPASLQVRAGAAHVVGDQAVDANQRR